MPKPRKNYYKYNPNRGPWRRWNAYGITQAEYGTMLERQGGLCAICTIPMSPGKGTHVDHDHITDQVRGLLCSSCNHSLGHLESMDSTTVGEYLNAKGC